MLGDTGSEALFRIDAFEKVPAFKALLEKDLEKAGKTLGQFFNMDAATKQDAIVAVKKRLFSSEYIAEMNLSMGAQIESMKGKLFDPTSGVFGFLREIRVDGESNTVFKELGRTFSVISAKIGEIVESLGITGDPLEFIIRGLKSVREFVSGRSGINFGAIGGMIGTTGTAVISMLGKGLVFAAQSMASLLTKMNGSEIQGNVAVLTNGIVTSMIGTLRSVNWAGFLQALPMAILGAFALIGNIAIGVIGGLVFSIPDVVSALGGSLFGFIKSLATVLTGAAGVWVPTVMLTWAEIGSSLSNSFSSLLVILGEGLGNIKNNLSGAFSGLGARVSSAFSEIIAGVPNALSGIGSAISGLASSIVSQISNMASNALSGLTSSITGGSTPSRYSGQNQHLLSTSRFSGGLGAMNNVGNAFGGLFDAARLEAQRKPSGSHLVMANSSELIVPRNQIQSMIQPNQISITINSRPNEIVNDVVAALTNALNRESVSMI
jgi:hypothetical protein